MFNADGIAEIHSSKKLFQKSCQINHIKHNDAENWEEELKLKQTKFCFYGFFRKLCVESRILGFRVSRRGILVFCL